MKIIKKKIWPKYFELVKAGKKRFELRVEEIEKMGIVCNPME